VREEHSVRFPTKIAAFGVLLLAIQFLRAQQIASATGKYDLTASDLVIPLKPQSGTSLSKLPDAIHSNLRLYLRVSHLQAVRQPGVLYAVYLEPVGTITRSDASRVGYINFFSVNAGAKGNPFTFEVTGIVRTLLSAKPELAGLQVRIVPGGPPESTPSIGSIELIAN
jgi:hypothetical protein